MSATQTQHEEVQALRREVEALRAERAQGAVTHADRGTLALLAGSGTESESADAAGGNDWTELKHLAAQFAQELEAAARERPVLGVLGAFAVGLVLGRLLRR